MLNAYTHSCLLVFLEPTASTLHTRHSSFPALLLQVTAFVAGYGGHFLYRERATARRNKTTGRVSCMAMAQPAVSAYACSCLGLAALPGRLHACPMATSTDT